MSADPSLRLLRFFEYAHLPEDLSEVSRPFCVLAHLLTDGETFDIRGPELTVCLRKLLEAKDCAVRAALEARDE